MNNGKKTKDEILDLIFKDFKVKYELKEFSKKDIEALNISEESNKYYVACPVSEKKKVAKPEEIVRQLWINKLTKEYGYPLERIEVEYPVWFGSGVEKKSADIVILQKDKNTVWIVGEIKRPDRKEGIRQLKSYLNAEGSPIGFWSDGKELIVLHRPYPHGFITLPDIPRNNEKIEDLINKKVTIADLENKIKEKGQPSLKDLIIDLEDLVLARKGIDVFEETFKLLFAKLYDEFAARNIRKDNAVEFRVKLGESDDELLDRVSHLFISATEKWQGVFASNEKEIKLNGASLKSAVSHLENLVLFESDLRIIDEAFEYLISKVSKGEKGQYFTPRHVIDMCVKMLNPTVGEYVLDPASGSGGFLVHTMFQVWKNIKNEKDRIKYSGEYLYGVDFDEKAQKVSKAIMLIAGDGSSNVFRLNSLEPWTWKGETGYDALKKFLLPIKDYEQNKENQNALKYLKFDLILTNPPFAGDINEKEILRFYDIAKKNKKIVNKLGRHILFLERCIHFLKPGGRMAIVLPQGVLNNTNMEYIREFLFDKARILAVVGLEINTFKPHTGTKTSVLFLQKWDEKEKPLKDYPIFMAVSKKSGKDNSGDYVYKKADNGNYAVDDNGHGIIEHDLNELAEEFIKFAKKEKFDFWG
ncbi:MAG TPA: SAM-dependent methyltransferase [Elusimicrobia bacterium]|nr:SAM-dependent methyltransferase [Elusimicrobiota bacterium]